MHHSWQFGKFADREIRRFFPGPSGYGDKNDRNAFRGERVGNRIAFQVNPSDRAIPFGQQPEFALRPPIESGLG
jgi:hypothetical protein